MICKTLLTVLILSFPLAAVAQNTRPRTSPAAPPSQARPPGDSLEDSDQDVNLPHDMRIRLAIERQEAEHRKFLDDVKQLNTLSTEVVEQYQRRGSLSPDDLKKVSTIEKLAKRILSHAGGDKVEDKSADSGKLSLAEAIKQLGEAAANINKSAMTETRHVVSATLIGNSNEVINLTQLIRRTRKQAN